MRLIDANALLKKSYWHSDSTDYRNLFPDAVEAVDVKDIVNAPTIDLQKYATRIYDRPGHWYCSECKTMFGRACLIYKHCYNCGAKFKQLLECAYYEDGRCLGTKWIDSVQCEGNKRLCICNKEQMFGFQHLEGQQLV